MLSCCEQVGTCVPCPGECPSAEDTGPRQASYEQIDKAGMRSDRAGESNGSSSSHTQELEIPCGLARLHDFFAGFGGLLGNLTLGSDNVAEQKSECQDELFLLMNLVKDQRGAGLSIYSGVMGLVIPQYKVFVQKGNGPGRLKLPKRMISGL